MSRLVMIVVFVGGVWYLIQKGNAPIMTPPPPPPPALDAVPAPVLTEQELEKVRLATKDSESSVRWAAIELLYKIHDATAMKTLEDALAIDTEPSVRRQALALLKTSKEPGVAKNLVAALKDSEKDIRMAALMALGELGDPSLAPPIVEMMKDIEPDVRLQAIHSLGSIQEKRLQEYKKEQELLRQEYEKAVRHSQETGFKPLNADGNFFDHTKAPR